MTETILRVRLDELTTVRVRCTNCDRVTEVAVTDLGSTFQSYQCQHCHQNFLPDKDGNAFADYSRAVARLAKLSEQAAIEFVVEDPDA